MYEGNGSCHTETQDVVFKLGLFYENH